MVKPTFLAALLAAFPSVLAQSSSSNNTSYFIRCTTRFGYYPLPTGTAGVPTWYTFIESTNTFVVTTTSQDTITVTPNATVCGGIITETSTVTTTSTATPAAITVPDRSGQLPLLRAISTAAALTNPTPIPRIKGRSPVAGTDLEVTHLVNRQTLPGNTGGFIVNPDGSVSYLGRIFPHRVLCEQRRVVGTTSTVTATGAPTTVVLPPASVTAFSTTTVTTTVTLVQTAPTPRVYAACRGNNVVNSITDQYGNRINFDRIVYRPRGGFPIANELVVNTTNAVNCCGACQKTPNCAGSFFVPSRRECHIRLTAPPPPPSNSTLLLPSNGNSTFPVLPSGTGIGTGISLVPTGTSGVALPSSTANPWTTCARGSDTLYLGTIRGRSPAELGDEVALVFSNGPCGRFSVSTRRGSVGV
ncbi:uncharacterized protein EI97DRAFT_443503 [Westerdykella ornata]|uniref:Apple domain-containing protein n=1 Tax=Westerdykella ornata TaxID=318751 RepID=A0A6A6JF75_WESOR|nr:uncharacterized protein EI97DRAFT_443503 [Westerdykella ornata]KAF2275270.1 hypothetical protein EI97DRAFT_443503 [Westerdykella ornata]